MVICVPLHCCFESRHVTSTRILKNEDWHDFGFELGVQFEYCRAGKKSQILIEASFIDMFFLF